jgi:CHAT domain-containing protein/tetratricopeptide (TPR) repeat protein
MVAWCFSMLLVIPACGQTAPFGQVTSGTSDQLLPGVVVEKVEKNSKAEKAGLREGDVLLRWSRGEAQGGIYTPVDVSWLQLEQSPQGPVRLEGTRAGLPISWVIGIDYWGVVESRLNFPTALLSGYVEANELVRAGKAKEAYEHWQALASHLPAFSSARTWVLFYAGYLFQTASRWEQSNQAYSDAIESASGNRLFLTFIYGYWATSTRYQRDLTKAAQLCDEAIRHAEQPAPSNLTTASFLQPCIAIAVDRGDLALAERYARSQRGVWLRLAPNSYGSLINLINLGTLASDRGDLLVAQSYYREAFTRWRDSIPPIVLADTFWGLGWVLHLRGDNITAERYYRKGLSIYQRSYPKYSGGPELLQNLAFLAMEQGDFSKADKYLKEALRFHAMPRIRAGFLNDLGELRTRQGDLKNARKYLLQAYEIRAKVAPGSLILASTLMDLGEVARLTGDQPTAEQCYRDALDIREKNSPGSTGHAMALAAMAGMMRGTHRVDDASALYDKALAALESQTSRLGGDNDARSGFRAKHAGIYIDYVNLLLSQNKQDIAFSVLERFRARSLLETLSTAHVDLHNGVESALLMREHSLEADINAKSERRIRLMSEVHDQKQAKEVEKEIADRLVDYHDLEEQIRSSSPAYAALTQPQPLTAKEVQAQLLDADTLLLEYSLGEERSYVFAVTPDSLQAFELPNRALVEKASRRLYRLFTARNVTVKGETELQKQDRIARAAAQSPRAAAELSKMILSPVASQLQSKRLLIVSDGALAYVPFSVLSEPLNTNAAVSATATPAIVVPLMVNHEIVNLPSASVLAVLRQQELGRKPAPKAVMVLADPVFDRHDPRLAFNRASSATKSTLQPGTGRAPLLATESSLDTPVSAGLLTRSAADVGLTRNGELRLPRLRFTRQEADDILAVTPEGAGKKAVDFEASRATATSPELSQYRIVHFATHGLLDSLHPELSGLVFSMVDAKGRPQDGFLELQDIYNLNLPADLVVLSACETGLGREINGEGLVGLTRGFMYAGASRVMASLWKVSDAGTAALMGNIYRAMETDGLPPAAALRAAQIKMSQTKRWRDPYYWAAFQLQGEWK